MLEYDPIIHKINSDLFSEKGIDVSVLRLDLIDPIISGNKWFKLKYNLEEAKKQGCDTILTFGGAFSNHIHATAAACKKFGFKCIGVISGEEEYKRNSTLSEAAAMGMQLHFVSRNDYRRKNDESFLLELKNKFGHIFIVPEGGNNYLGSLGCTEILKDIDEYDYAFCSVGTSATFCGLAISSVKGKIIIGISVLKGEGNLIKDAQLRVNELRKGDDLKMYCTDEILNDDVIKKSGIISGYHFGGFARHSPELLVFKNQFENETEIQLDYVYESKLFYAVNDLIRKNKIPEHSKVMMVHGGGLQGNKGYEDRYALNPRRKVNEAQGYD